MHLPGYSIEAELYRGRKRVVYRARRDADGAAVIIKGFSSEFPTPADTAALRREHEILTSLDAIPGVARTVALLSPHGQPALVLADSGGISLKQFVVHGGLPLGLFLGAAAGLAATVAEFHRRGIIHRDINPNNLLLDLGAGTLTLIDFGLASRTPSQSPRSAYSSGLEGTIAYMSPEQTGRMNRDVDHRTDLYSLGVTFFELLTGRLPFDSLDPLEVVHGHIARIPPSPHEFRPDLPRVLSQIVLKLLAKTPEDRYQSATGLRADLMRCRTAWESNYSIAHFAVGTEDVVDRFVVPQQLYGREEEVLALRQAFDAVLEGPPAFTAVGGYSGVGKTALVRELYRPLVGRRGYFIAGKFDQMVRLPFGALIQAIRELIRQLLAEEESQLVMWRTRLTEALGPLGGIVAEVIPEIELILGPQPTPTPLGSTEAESRFRLVFQRFLQTLAREDHPLVIFLDDLQWADSATLDLLTPLLTSPDIRYFFLIGAYRDNEVDAAHPLTRVLEDLEAAGVRLQRIGLRPLRLEDVSRLVRDTLRREGDDIAPLALLVLHKTGGNPFFAIQFLKALHDAGLLHFDHDRGRWAFDIAAIAGAGMTDNVIELMTRKLQRLPPRAQTALTLGACIGNQFDLPTLAVVSRQSPQAAAEDLSAALEQGLVLCVAWTRGDRGDGTGSGRPSERFAFLHDRVQQAAYAMIPDQDRQRLHLTVGRLLLDRWDPKTSDERLFDTVHHLNLGRSLLTQAEERVQLAGLNLAAGRKAKTSTAYQAADGYLTTGIGLLTATDWDTEYQLMFALHLDSAEVAYLRGMEGQAAGLVDTLLQRAGSRLDRSRVYALKTVHYEYLARYREAIQAGRQGLALFGLDYPADQEQQSIALAELLADIDRLIGDRKIAELIDLPAMVDPEIRAVMKLLTSLHTPCYLSGDKTLTMLNTATMVRLSLQHGNLEDSAHAYVLHAMVVGPILGRLEEAYEFGVLALRLSERFGETGLRAKVHMNFSWNVSLWRRPFQDSLEHSRIAHRLGNESGLFADAVYALFNEVYFTLLNAAHLQELEPLQEAHISLTRRYGMDFFADGPQVIFQWGRALRQLTEAQESLSDAGFSEANYLLAHGDQRLFLMFFHVAKLALHYTLGRYRQAQASAQEAEKAIQDYTGTIWDELRVFYYTLTLCALHDDEADTTRRAQLQRELDALEARLAHWAENSPENFRAQHLLVSAEIARIRGDIVGAVTHYERAIAEAGEHLCPSDLALANEHYGLFWLARGQTRTAETFLLEARSGYSHWGAVAKVVALDIRFPDLMRRMPVGVSDARSEDLTVSLPTRTTTQVGESALDLVTVMKAARALAGEIELEELLGKLMRIAIENAGAQRGVLVLEQDGSPWVRAEGSASETKVRPAGEVPLALADLPASIAHYTSRTGESVVLNEALDDPRFRDDEYLARCRPRSVLCTPVLNQGRLLGLLYLENNLAAGAFTADRTQMLQILVSQAAIAIENARMFGEIRQLRDRLQAENVYLIEEIRTHQGFEEIVGRTPILMKVLAQVEQVAPTETTVLITGETGTGKELVARAVHNLSRRKDRPLVTINCGAISAGLVESELFGHEKGSFTGAISRKIGRFELADGGTIFLDEIGDLPAALQVKLLRVLQEGEIERVGGNRQIQVDVRVIAATHRDLEQLVREGRFRADLFYRLSVFPVRTPALRERRQDIPLLVRYFVLKYAQKLGKRIDSIPAELMDSLSEYPWPGNVRELGNVLERSVIISRGPVLELGDWIPMPRTEGASPVLSGGPRRLQEVERGHIIAALERTGWKVSGPNGAAAVLGLKPTTLESRMKKLGINRPR